MTTLFSWTGVDTHGSASIYIASDSRISWGPGAAWDSGKKVFAARKHPEIFGYSGYVIFPIQILNQLIELIDSDFLFQEHAEINEKVEAIKRQISSSYKSLPTNQQIPCEIIYATRIGDRMRSKFHVWKFQINNRGVFDTPVSLPETSGLIVYSGTGSTALKSWCDEWEGKPNSLTPLLPIRTSRYIFSAFCDSLNSEQDPHSGGAPQLVGLYRVGSAKNFGIIYKDKRFFNGLEIKEPESLSNSTVEWRNELFEVCCVKTMQILDKAQRQPKPKEVKKPA